MKGMQVKSGRVFKDVESGRYVDFFGEVMVLRHDETLDDDVFLVLWRNGAWTKHRMRDWSCLLFEEVRSSPLFGDPGYGPYSHIHIPPPCFYLIDRSRRRPN